MAAIVDMKRRNPTWGCPRIAQQITLACGIPMNKDVVRRILAVRYTPKPDAEGPSWLTALGHAKDRLWSVDLFRCESAVLLPRPEPEINRPWPGDPILANHSDDIARRTNRRALQLFPRGRLDAERIDALDLLSIHWAMANSTERKRPVRREARVSRTYRLPLSKLKAAQRALGAATATEAIERALDLAVFQRELADGTRAMLGVDITSPDIEP